MFHEGLGCSHQKKLDFTAWHYTLSDSDGTPRGVTRMTPDGTAGTQNFLGRIVGVGPSQEVAILAEGLNNPNGIDVYPGFTPPLGGVAVFFQINSPVSVLITGPDGRRIGVDPNTSQFVNDYGDAGYDSNTNEPHIYGIRDPLPGDYTIATKGTGSGPYTISTFGANLGTDVITQASVAGDTSPGSPSAHVLGVDGTGQVTIVDGDGDGYDDSREAFLGTDTVDACPDNTADDAWPPDIQGSEGCGFHDGDVDLLDILCYKPKVSGPYDRRYDLDTNDTVNILDVLLYKPVYGVQCTNP
jgi:hypothetical protein